METELPQSSFSQDQDNGRLDWWRRIVKDQEFYRPLLRGTEERWLLSARESIPYLSFAMADDGSANSLKDMMEKLATVVKEQGEELLPHIREEDPDLNRKVTNVKLPDMQGCERFFQRLKLWVLVMPLELVMTDES